MPRIPRGQHAGFVYHVINRENGRATIFHKPQDYFGLRLFQPFQKPALSLSKGSIAALTNYESRSIVPVVQPLCSVHHGDQSVPNVPDVQSLRSVQDVSG